jgi:hemerythrin HHE cation binding domain-containing protein
MNAIQLLRGMHADTKVSLKVVLGTEDPALADQAWRALQPSLELHETLEDEFVYQPLQEEMGPGTPLGDWNLQHDADVAVVEELVAASNQLEAGSPDWRMCVGRVMDALSKHVMDEEGQIFGRIEQVWDATRLEQAGEQMQQRLSANKPASPQAKPATARRRR